MSKSNHWLLPDGVEELLPPQAWLAESLRRRLLDLYRNWGYELISPPLIEYLESLLSGTGNDLDLQTFKVTDQLTGRLMGVRADITPQAARVDAHCWKKEGVSRLCYADSVLHTTPENQMTGRSPIQIGCELFGSRALESDVEVLRLTVETLLSALNETSGRSAQDALENVHIDLSHVGIYKGLLEAVDLNVEQEAQLTDALRRKSIPDVSYFLNSLSLDGNVAEQLKSLPALIGGEAVLAEAESLFASASQQTIQSLLELKGIYQQLKALYPRLSVSIDLSELRGYNYHTGLVFAGYVKGHGRAIVKGGRYDAVGEIFGRGRAATGFSCDLKSLVCLLEAKDVEAQQIVKPIYAPADTDPALLAKIAELRQTDRVVQGFSDDVSPQAMGCDRVLRKRDSCWQVETLA